MFNFELKVNQIRYSGWETIQVTKSIEQLAHSFSVGFTDKTRTKAEKLRITEGNTCSILVDGETIVSGYIDEINQSYSENSRASSFSGRSKTGQIVDCSAVHKTGQWSNTGLLRIAKDLCDPFDIDVSTNVDLGRKFINPGFKLQEGESCFDAISRAATARGVMLTTNADGDLVFDRAGSKKVKTAIERGKNVKSGSKLSSLTDRFSNYTLKTQASGNDESFGKNTSLKASASDSGVTLYRPTILIADNEDSIEELKKRATWERNVRAGRSRRLSYTVFGWAHLYGLWEPNTLIKVIDDELDVNDELLAVSVTLTRDSSGTLTTIDLTDKHAFDVQPFAPEKRKDGVLF